MTTDKPLILISNDDGIQVRGIQALAKVAAKYGDVVVVAPDKGYSGQSHSITVGNSLKVTDYNIGIDGVKAYMVSGSPVDCIKLGYHALVSRKPAIVLSGINHGSNTSSSVHYSGTMGAVREGALLGIKGMGFSLANNDETADLTTSMQIADKLIAWLLAEKISADTYFSVNIPSVEKVQGIKIVRMSDGHWREDYHMAEDPWNGKHYWLVGTFINDEPNATDTDEYWLMKNYVTLCPLKLNVTATDVYERIKNIEF